MGGENSRTTEPRRLEYPLPACTWDNASPVGVHETAAYPHLVAQPAGRLACGVDEGDLATADCDTPAWRPSNVGVDEGVAPGSCANCMADYQAVCRRVDLESSDQLSLQIHLWGLTLNRQTGE
jgi:hypothetical protein